MADQQKYTGKLKEQRVVVFGGSSGLGYAASEAAVEDGASVIIVSSREASIQSAITKMNSHYPSAVDRITGHTCDLRSNNLEEQILAVFEKIGQVDHIVFTAGDDLVMDGIHNISYDRVIQAGQTRFFAPLFVAKSYLSYTIPTYQEPTLDRTLAERFITLKQTPRSSITFTGGVIIEKPRPGWTVQASYAAGMLGMHRGLAIDLAPIRVNLVSPGATETEMWKLDQKTEEEAAVIRKSLGQELLTGQIGRPEDVAEAYMHSMRDYNMTGSHLMSHGGWTPQ